MRAKITKASDYFDVDFKDFDTLEDLLKFQEECNEALIIAPAHKLKNGEMLYDMTIYDDYVESDSDPIVPLGKKFIVSYDEDGEEFTEELIRCKDCKYFEIEDSDIHYWCTNWQHYREPEDYCSDAERREG